MIRATNQHAVKRTTPRNISTAQHELAPVDEFDEDPKTQPDLPMTMLQLVAMAVRA